MLDLVCGPTYNIGNQCYRLPLMDMGWNSHGLVVRIQNLCAVIDRFEYQNPIVVAGRASGVNSLRSFTKAFPLTREQQNLSPQGVIMYLNR